MRKAFRVATVFTGAATCAATFTPAATATAGTTAMINEIKPHTTVKNCTTSITRSAVFYWSPNEHHGPTCVGGEGGKSVISLQIFNRRG
jgi:hypothetical protein